MPLKETVESVDPSIAAAAAEVESKDDPIEIVMSEAASDTLTFVNALKEKHADSHEKKMAALEQVILTTRANIAELVATRNAKIVHWEELDAAGRLQELP